MGLSYEERLKTFCDWKPASGLLSFDLEQLADSGLYFNKAIDGNDDPGRLRCQFCPAVISNWRPTDDVWIEHLTATNKICRHICLHKGADFISAKLSEANFHDALTKDNCRKSMFHLDGLEEPTRFREHHASSVTEICNEDMKDRESRLATFRSTTSEYLNRNREILADAGFYFVGLGEHRDSVTCYCCGRSLYDHKDWDNPWEQHAQFKCRHVFEKKGLEFIRKAIQCVSRCESNLVSDDGNGRQISGANEVSNKRKHENHDKNETVQNHHLTNNHEQPTQKYWQSDKTDEMQERKVKRLCQRSIHRKQRHGGEKENPGTTNPTSVFYIKILIHL